VQEANFVAKPTFDFTVNGHLILSTKQDWNYGGVRTISCTSSF
jgi:hypothetical protein